MRVRVWGREGGRKSRKGDRKGFGARLRPVIPDVCLPFRWHTWLVVRCTVSRHAGDLLAFYGSSPFGHPWNVGLARSAGGLIAGPWERLPTGSKTRTAQIEWVVVLTSLASPASPRAHTSTWGPSASASCVEADRIGLPATDPT